MNLSGVRSKIRKKYGSSSVPAGDDILKLGYIPYGISTQSLQLDLAIGRPGIPGGRITQIIGVDGCGKSTLVQQILAECHRIGGHAALAETEGAYEAHRLKQLGCIVDEDHITPLYPTNLEEVHGETQEFIKGFSKDNPDVPFMVIIDSLDGFHAEAAMDADPNEALPAIDARCNGVQIPKLATYAAQHKAAVVIVQHITPKFNQQRTWRPAWAPPEYNIKGGEEAKYRASLRLQVKRGAVEKEKDAMATKVEVLKNKLAAPFKIAEYRLAFDIGMDHYNDLFEAAKTIGVISGGAGGRYHVKLGKKLDETIYEREWKGLVDDRGGPHKFRDRLTRRAIKRGFLRAYGLQQDDEPPAESDAIREPTGDEESAAAE